MKKEVRLEPLQCPFLREIKGIRHGYFTRIGGVSEGLYSSLNVSFQSYDTKDHIIENRSLIAQWANIEPSNFVLLHQVHSGNVITLKQPLPQFVMEGDGLVTDCAKIAIGIMTADCGPILFADSSSKIIGVAHAGWRGVLANIIENTVEKMVALGAQKSSIVSCLGPCISQANYEVDKEFFETFQQNDSSAEKYFLPSIKQDHFMFNLQTCILDRLGKIGVQSSHIEKCTYEEETLFYSYRRSLHKNETDYGRQASVIILE